jgi:hypothetical protein
LLIRRIFYEKCHYSFNDYHLNWIFLSTTLSVQGLKNEGNAWVLLEVINIDGAEEIASANQKSESYHMEGKFWSIEQFRCMCRS